MKSSIYLRNKWHKSSTLCLYCFNVCVYNIMSYDNGICFIFLTKQTLLILLCYNYNVISWLIYYKCYIRYQICTLYAKMIRLCPDT